MASVDGLFVDIKRLRAAVRHEVDGRKYGGNFVD